MVLDIEEGFGNVGDSITKTKIFKQVTSDYERLKKKAGKTTEKKTSKIAKRFNKISKT